MEKKPRNKEVQPKIYKSEAKRPTVTFRVRGDLFEKLKASAIEAQMSISEEIERRLLLSISLSTTPQNEMILRMVRDAFELSEIVSGKKWFEDKATAHICYNAVISTLSVLFQKEINDPLNSEIQEQAKAAGDGVGVDVLMRTLGVSDEALFEKARHPVLAYMSSQAFREALASELIKKPKEQEAAKPAQNEI